MIKKNENIKLLSHIQREDRNVTKNTLRRFNTAKESAQSVEMPNRSDLLEIYKDCLDNDGHLFDIISQRKKRITGLNFQIVQQKNKIDEKLTKIFSEQWFEYFLNYAMDTIFWGNSLLEFEYNQGINITLVPREHVIPETQMVKYSQWNYSGDIDYTAPVYSKHLLELNNENDPTNLGLLLTLAQYSIFKTDSTYNWLQYAELFGQPTRVFTTDSTNPAELNKIHQFAKEAGKSGYAIVNSNTELDFKESNSNHNDLFKGINKYLNDEMSKAVLGATMLTDDGSSRSQADVHKSVSYLITKSDIKLIEYIINDQLLPLLNDLKVFGYKKVEFKFIDSEIYSVEERLKINEFLLSKFDVDIDYFENMYDVDLKPKKEVEVKEVKKETDGKTDKG